MYSARRGSAIARGPHTSTIIVGTEGGAREEEMSTADSTLVIGRALGTVVVTVGGDLDATAIDRLERVLTDLIDGQGNLAVAIDLSRAVATPRAVDTFVTTQRARFR